MKASADNAKNNRCDELAAAQSRAHTPARNGRENACFTEFLAALGGRDRRAGSVDEVVDGDAHSGSTNGLAVVRAIPGFFHITHIKNTGAAGRCSGQTCLFVLVTAAFFAIVGVLIWKKVLQKRFELYVLPR